MDAGSQSFLRNCVALALVLPALASTPAQPVLEHDCPTDNDTRMVLSQASSMPISDSLPPRALSFAEDRIWFLTAADGSVQAVAPSGSALFSDRPEELTVLGVGRAGHVLATTGTAVYRWSASPPYARQDVDSRLRPGERITGLFGSGDRMWLAVADGTRARALIVPIGARFESSRSDSVLQAELPGPARLHPRSRGGAIAAVIGYPYHVVVFDSIGNETVTTSPVENLGWTERVGAASSVFAVSALPLDCDRILHFLTDLGSDRRWIVIYDADGSVIRVRQVSAPFGLVQSLYPEQRELVGVKDTPERREVVFFTWTWERSQQQ